MTARSDWVAAVRGRPGRVGFLAGVLAGGVLTALVGALPLSSAAPGPEGVDGDPLVILSGVDDGGQRQELIDQWNASGDGPRAEIISVGGGTDAERTAMVSAAKGEGPAADIYNLDVTLMAEFVGFGYVRPLDAARIDTEGFLAKPLETCRRPGDGRLWALPFNTDAALLYYRSDLLGDAEPPTSWAGVVNAVERVFAADPDSDLEAGYAGQFDDYEGLTVNAIEAISAAGGQVVADGEVVVGSPEAREGINRLARGLSNGNPQLILPGSVAFKEGDTTEAFRDGRVMFMRNWPKAYRELADGESGGPAVPFQVTRVPGRSVLGGQNLAVAASSDQPRAAQKLIEFLTSAYSQQILFERGGFAATREIVYHDTRIRERYGYADTLRDAITQADQRPDTPYYALFSSVFRQGIRDALDNGGQLPDDFADELSDALRGVLRE